MWSRSQDATGEIFLDLKRNRDEPDAAAAALVGLPLAHDGTPLVGAAAAGAVTGGVVTATYEMAAAAVASGAAAAALAAGAGAGLMGVGGQGGAAPVHQEVAVNQSGIELLRRLPGVTDANWRRLAEGVGSLAGLADAPVEWLEELMGGGRAARTLHAFLHAPCPRLAGGGSDQPRVEDEAAGLLVEDEGGGGVGDGVGRGGGEGVVGV